MLSYIIWPTVTSTISGAADWLNPLLTEFWTPLTWVLGIGIFGTIAGLLISWMVHRR